MLKKITLISTFVFSTSAFAAPHDLYLTAQELKPSSHQLKLDLAIDAVNDTIDIFDMREAEGITDKSAGDYLGFHLAAQYDISPEWAIEGRFWNREIEYTLDTNELQSYLVALRYVPELGLKKNDRLAFRASLWGNTADVLSKTTATRVNNYQFSQVHVKSPEDLQFQLDGIFSRKLDFMNQINAFVSLGYSQVDVGSLDVQAQYQGCLMDIRIQNNNHYTGQLARPCVRDGLTFTELAVSGDAEQFGLNVQQDLNYDSYFASVGGSWNWRYRQFASQIAYQYQYLWRDKMDDRVNQFGNSAIKDNHTLGIKLSYDFHPQVSAFLQGEIYQHNLVGYVPFLYNGVTASRLDKRYGLASIGLQFHAF